MKRATARTPDLIFDNYGTRKNGGGTVQPRKANSHKTLREVAEGTALKKRVDGENITEGKSCGNALNKSFWRVFIRGQNANGRVWNIRTTPEKRYGSKNEYALITYWAGNPARN